MNLIDKDILLEYVEKHMPKSNFLEKVKRGYFDFKDYELLCRTLVNARVKNYYCNGYFGRDYDLENSIVTGMWEEDYSFDDKIQVIVELQKVNRRKVTGYFDDWQEVYEHLTLWMKESGYDE